MCFTQIMFPTSWLPQLGTLLPRDASRYAGAMVAWWGAVVCLVVVTGRSLVHLLSRDGGATSIATIDTDVAGGSNIIALFGQWGASQLLLAVLLWVLLLRYRGLTSLVLLVFFVEPILRSLSGHLKPLETVGTAPGAALNWLAVPVTGVLLWLSLCPGRRERRSG
ncbi:unannotated protein [freshwater metagenome]|uniref:Unannotated protein n=1 Tax=freshwater metagenome TaxID=449393 RepID=A0A6J7PCX0_9ZZZZ